MKKGILAATIMALAIVVLALSACAGTADRAFMFDKGVLEPKADKIYDVGIRRLCALPLDIQLRAVRRKTVTLSALTEMCPDWFEIFARSRLQKIPEGLVDYESIE